MKILSILLLIMYIYEVNSFYNILLPYKNIKRSKIQLYNKKNNDTNKFSSDIYLNTLSYKKNITKFNNMIKNINLDNIVLYNKLINAVYYKKNLINSTLNNDKIIIELKNKTRYYYELNDKDSFLIDTIFDYNDEIEYINLKDYPYYILNSPLGYLKEEK